MKKSINNYTDYTSVFVLQSTAYNEAPGKLSSSNVCAVYHYVNPPEFHILLFFTDTSMGLGQILYTVTVIQFPVSG